MNSRVATFINNHEEEIDSNDFHSVFTAAYNELNNDDTKVLYLDLCDTFGDEFISKQRETALYFVLTMVFDDVPSGAGYAFGDLLEQVLHRNSLGLKETELMNYIADNLYEFDLVMEPFGSKTVFRKM